MIRLHAPNGTPVDIDGKFVVRVRRTVAGEDGQTHIDWTGVQLVNEPVNQVAASVKEELPSLASLTAPDGSSVWFNAKQAVGPLSFVPSQAPDGTKSFLRIANFRQFVTETPEQVRTVIAAAGGTPVSETDAVS